MKQTDKLAAKHETVQQMLHTRILDWNFSQDGLWTLEHQLAKCIVNMSM